MNILAIGAHPDDIEILCAGTLALYAKAGHHVTMAVFTDGSMGDLKIAPAKLAKIRREEQQAAADIIGARLLWPAITDEHVFPNEAQRSVMIDLLREADPDVRIVLLTLYNPFSGSTVPAFEPIGDLALEGAPDTPFPEGLNDRIRAEAQAAGVTLADLYPLFVGKGREYIALDLIHPNDTGYRVMADTVLASLGP